MYLSKIHHLQCQHAKAVTLSCTSGMRRQDEPEWESKCCRGGWEVVVVVFVVVVALYCVRLLRFFTLPLYLQRHVKDEQ